jgi:hypothetical protein
MNASCPRHVVVMPASCGSSHRRRGRSREAPSGQSSEQSEEPCTRFGAPTARSGTIRCTYGEAFAQQSAAAAQEHSSIARYGALVNRYGAAFVESFFVERAVGSSLRRAWSLRSACRLCYSRSMMRHVRCLVWSLEPYDLVSETYCRPIARYPRLRATLKSSHPATTSAHSVA